jgi:very-short-patch-repair endonuclease
MDDHPIVFSRKINRKKIERSKEFRRIMTKAERVMWCRLRAHRFRGLHFRRQTVIGPYIVDFYCHCLRLVVEVDGDVHESQKGMDVDRDSFLKAMGLLVVRFPNSRVMSNIEGVLAELDVVCAELQRP